MNILHLDYGWSLDKYTYVCQKLFKLPIVNGYILCCILVTPLRKLDFLKWEKLKNLSKN